jgi:hypothetical protein
VVTSDSRAAPSIFRGYHDVAAKSPDAPMRRWATLVPIGNWEAWVAKITRMALAFLDMRATEGLG